MSASKARHGQSGYALEQTELPIASGPPVVSDRVNVEGVATGLADGAADALTRP
jgi:hypothetical protein